MNETTPAFRPATLDEYLDWLASYTATVGTPTHFYDYPWSGRGMVTALRDFTTNGECGSLALDIIVPSGVRHVGGDLGHCHLYYAGGLDSGGFVPVYGNPEFADLPGLREWIAEERHRQAVRDAQMRRDMAAREIDLEVSDVGRWHLTARATEEAKP